LIDQSDFVRQGKTHLVRHALGIACLRADVRKMDEGFLGCVEAVDDFIRVFVAQFVERKSESLRKSQSLVDSCRMVAEQTQHFMSRLQMPLGVSFELAASAFKRGVFADAGQHILQRAARGSVIEHIVDGDEGDAGDIGCCGKGRKPATVETGIGHAGSEAGMIGYQLTQGCECVSQRDGWCVHGGVVVPGQYDQR
jgi:hypothetical protein